MLIHSYNQNHFLRNISTKPKHIAPPASLLRRKRPSGGLACDWMPPEANTSRALGALRFFGGHKGRKNHTAGGRFDVWLQNKKLLRKGKTCSVFFMLAKIILMYFKVFIHPPPKKKMVHFGIVFINGQLPQPF